MLAGLFRDPPQIEGLTPNWDVIVGQASAAYILPALHRQLDGIRDSHPVPEERREISSATEPLNAERNEAILSEAVHAAKLLDKIGVQPVALKGLAYLLMGTYPNKGRRYLLDVDILLESRQIIRAAEYLCQNGYCQSESSTFLRFRHHYPAIRRPGSPDFEIHRQVILGDYNRLLEPSDLLANTKFSKPLKLSPLPSNCDKPLPRWLKPSFFVISGVTPLLSNVLHKPSEELRCSVFGFPAFFILFGCATAPQLSSKILTYLGDPSYSIYLTHGFFSMTLAAVLKRLTFLQSIPADILLILASAITIIFTSFTYKFLKKPLLRIHQSNNVSANSVDARSVPAA